MRKRILLIDPTSIHHGPPESIKEADNFINKQYVDKINEILDLRCNEPHEKALSSKYISNYGLLMLASLLKKDYEVNYINGDYFNNKKEFANCLKKIIINYDLIALTSVTPQFKEVKSIAEMIKNINPEIKIVLGGPHSRYYLTHEVDDCLDCVLIGYGLDKSKEYIDKLLKGEKIPSKIETNYYYDGCPNDCKYCVEHKFVNKLAFNCLDKKFAEVNKLVNKFNVKFVHLADSDFLIHKKTVEEFIKYVKTNRLNFCFSINTSPISLIRYINDDILKELVDIGLIEILIGAEHFSSKVLNNMAKIYDINSFIKSLYYLREANVPIISLYTLVGLPGEHEKEIQENIQIIKYLKENNLYDFTFPKFFVPYPDSDIYLHPEKYNVIIKNDNWDEYQRWQLPRPIVIKGMNDQQYIDEIKTINEISLEEKYENNSITSLYKKRKQNINGSRE